MKKKYWNAKRIVFTSISAFLTSFIIFHSCLNGTASGKWSAFFSNFFKNTINTIYHPETPKVDVTGISLDLSNYVYNNVEGYASNEIPLGCTKALNVTITPAKASNKAFTVTSSNSNVLLSRSGNTIYVETHELDDNLKITVTSSDQGFTSEYTFKVVEPIAPQNFKINTDDETVDIGLSKRIDVELLSEQFNNELLMIERYYDLNQLTFTSSNPSVATVNNYGVIKGISAGTSTITISNGTLTYTKNITVQTGATPINPTGLSIKGNNVAYFGDMDFDRESQRGDGEYHTHLDVEFTNEPTDKSVTWVSSNELIAHVDQDGNVRGYRNLGHDVENVTIRAISNVDENIYADFDMTVEQVYATSMTLNKTSAEEYAQKTLTYSISYLPKNVTVKRVSATSSDENVATAQASGNTLSISTLRQGNATITVKYTAKEIEDLTFEMTVIEKEAINDENFTDFSQFVRKYLGHFLLFLTDGIFTTLAAYYLLEDVIKKRKYFVYLISFGFGVFIAGLSEFIQYFVPGRSGRMLDVGIDSLGYVIGLGIGFIILLITMLIRNKKKKKIEKTE